LITKNGKDLPRDNEQYGPDLFCDFIIDFIDKNSIHPFFIYYPMVLVHDPFVPTPDSPEWENKELRYKPDTAYYNDMVEYTDKIVSRIVLKLKEEGVWENTIIIFTGDNGTHPSVYSKTEHRIVRGGKGLSINTGNHVPMVVSWPTYNKKGRVYNGLLNFADFYPTLAEAAGVEKNQFKNDGESFLSIMEGSSESIKNEVFIHYSPRWGNKIHNRWVSDGIYKLYRNGSFYNTSIDLFEKNPIRKLSANEKVIKSRFRKIILEKEKESPFRKNDKIFDRVN
jgi:arylsulfatase A